MITPDPSLAGERGTGTLYRITPDEISARLGFAPNRMDDKCEYSWGFQVDGVHCGVWCFKGSEGLRMASTSGPREVLAAVFGDHVGSDKP